MSDSSGPRDDAAEDPDAGRGDVTVDPTDHPDRSEHDDSVGFLHDPDQQREDLGEPGPPLNTRSPFMWGLLGGIGALVALWIGLMVTRINGVILLVVVALFLAVGLNPAVEFLMRRGLKRPWAVLCVILGVLLVFAGFLTILVPIISHQVTQIGDNLPGWFDKLQRNEQIRQLDDKYDITSKVEDYVKSGAWAQKAFGGAVGVGLAILGALLNAFVVVVLTLYFLASLRSIRRAERRQRGPSRPMMISSKSSQASAADCVRLVGSLTSSASIQSEIPWSTCGSIDFTAGIGSLTCRSRIAIGASESWNGTRPVNISNAMQPTEYRSVHGPISCAIACSGAM